MEESRLGADNVQVAPIQRTETQVTSRTLTAIDPATKNQTLSKTNPQNLGSQNRHIATAGAGSRYIHVVGDASPSARPAGGLCTGPPYQPHSLGRERPVQEGGAVAEKPRYFYKNKELGELGETMQINVNPGYISQQLY